MKWWELINNTPITEMATHLSIKPMTRNSFSPCPACHDGSRGSSDNRGSLGTTENLKGWVCHVCKQQGNMLDLVSWHIAGNRYRDLSTSDRKEVWQWSQDKGFSSGSTKNQNMTIGKTIEKVVKFEKPKTKPVKVDPNDPFRFDESLIKQYKKNLWRDENTTKSYLMDQRKLSETVIEKADLGVMKYGSQEWLVIPLKNPEGDIINMKFRSLLPPVERKRLKVPKYRNCSGREMPLYGSDSLSLRNDDMVIICEGELDVLAMQTLGYNDNVVSGTTGAGAFADPWLDQLEKFKSFWIFFDGDQAGDEGAKKLSKRLGHYRCMRMRLRQFNDVGDLLSGNGNPESIDHAFHDAESFMETSLKTVGEYAEQLEKLINKPETMKGLSTGSMKLDPCIGGIRKGELWVVSGESGHGKTSWATWLLWSIAKTQNIPILLTSFEQSPIGTVQKLLRCELENDFTEFTAEERLSGLAALDSYPIRIYDHYGDGELDTLIESMRHAARRYDTQLFLVDHLGFLVRNDDDERRNLEEAIRKFATLAVQDNITILLICHPNNNSVKFQRRVKITDLKGASAIRQDAHVGVIVEKGTISADIPYPHTNIYFDKVRSEFGQSGSRCVMAYDPKAVHYADHWEITPAGKQGKRYVH